MTSFADLFQRHISSDSALEFSFAELEAASALSSVSQYPVNPVKVETLVKSILKDGILYINPLLASYGGADYNVSGRHRLAAATHICTHYGINAKGKVEVLTDLNAGTLAPIERRMIADYCVADSMRSLTGLILAANGSRSMSAPETASVKAMGGYATPSDKFKLRMSPYLAANLQLQDVEANPISTSAVTLAQIAGKIYTAIKGVDRASDEQLNALASHLNEYLNENCELPTTFAQHHSAYIVKFLHHVIELTDDNDEVIMTFDAQGEPIDTTYSQHFATLLPAAPPKVSKAPSKSKLDAEKFARMAAKLAELGVTDI